MEKQVKIPKGWKHIVRGAIQDGDLFLTVFKEFIFEPICVGDRVSDYIFVIRKAKNVKKSYLWKKFPILDWS
jgi:hypothetical protein